MSRDSSGENLEAILSSIRRSLAEQATSVLEEEAITPVELLPSSDSATDLDIPPIPASLARGLPSAPDRRQSAPTGVGGVAASGVDAPPPVAEGAPAVLLAARTQARTPTLTVVPAPAVALAAEPGQMAAPDPVIVPAPAVAPMPVVAPDAADAAPGQRDTLWFLSQEAGPRAAAQPVGAVPPPAPEPKPSRLGAVRGPLPPFFGSSAEAVKVEMAPDPPVLSGAGAMPPLTPAFVAPPPSPAAQSVDGVRTVNGEALRGLDAAPRAADSTGSVRTSSIFGPPPADARTGGAGEAPQPQIQALEAMVAELLRPMLRRWLDENMPRLVSAALKAEADLMSRGESGRDPKKP